MKWGGSVWIHFDMIEHPFWIVLDICFFVCVCVLFSWQGWHGITSFPDLPVTPFLHYNQLQCGHMDANDVSIMNVLAVYI